MAIDSAIIIALIGFAGGIVGGVLTAFLQPVAVAWWQARVTRRVNVSLSIDYRREGTWIWNLSDPDETGPPSVETVVATVRVPRGASDLSLERGEVRVISSLHEQFVCTLYRSGSDTSKPVQAEAGRRYEWTRDASSVRQVLNAKGLSGEVMIAGVVVDELGDEYLSDEMTFSI